MSWRTQGQYRGLGDADAAWLRKFDRDWDQKAQGRSHSDAMDHTVQSDGVEKKSVREDPEPFMVETLLIAAGARVRKISGPRPTAYGWEIRVFLACGRRTWARFPDEDSAVQAYFALCEFMHWFQAPTEIRQTKRQEVGSQPHESGPPLAIRPAQDAPRERGLTHLAVSPQNPPCDSTQPPTPLARSRPA